MRSLQSLPANVSKDRNFAVRKRRFDPPKRTLSSEHRPMDSCQKGGQSIEQFIRISKARRQFIVSIVSTRLT